MTPRSISASSVIIALAAACGGNTLQEGGAGAMSGLGGAGAATAAGGTGGAVAAPCKLPMESGPCNAAFPAFWHDAATGVCRPFVYGGCEGNANRFDTLDECQSACGGGVPDMDACSVAGECVLAAAGCCGACDQADARSFVAVNRESLDEYVRMTSCSVSCGECPDVSEFERTIQFLIATCESNHCKVVDLREADLTRCTTDTDCVLRDGAVCCEGCDATGIVVLKRGADLGALVCDPSGEACDECAPVFPAGYFAICEAGRCKLAARRD